MRRADTLMSESETLALLVRGVCARVATVGEDGWPYVIPLLYIYMDGRIWFHHTMVEGRLSLNIEHSNRVCVEVDEPGEVFRVGLTACGTSLTCRSLVAFGIAEQVIDDIAKKRCFDAFMAKYASHLETVPEYGAAFAKTAVYAITVERMTGKQKRDPRANAE